MRNMQWERNEMTTCDRFFALCKVHVVYSFVHVQVLLSNLGFAVDVVCTHPEGFRKGLLFSYLAAAKTVCLDA